MTYIKVARTSYLTRLMIAIDLFRRVCLPLCLWEYICLKGYWGHSQREGKHRMRLCTIRLFFHRTQNSVLSENDTGCIHPVNTTLSIII